MYLLEFHRANNGPVGVRRLWQPTSSDTVPLQGCHLSALLEKGAHCEGLPFRPAIHAPYTPGSTRKEEEEVVIKVRSGYLVNSIARNRISDTLGYQSCIPVSGVPGGGLLNGSNIEQIGNMMTSAEPQLILPLCPRSPTRKDSSTATS